MSISSNARMILCAAAGLLIRIPDSKRITADEPGKENETDPGR